MQIVTVQFNYPKRSNYKKVLDVFRYSCKKHMPEAKFNEILIDPPVNKSGRDLNFNYNSVKLKLWLEFVKSTKDNVILADCDMLARMSAAHAFKYDFDIAFTERTRIKRIPNNGGIMFVRPNERSIKFLTEMLRINNKMLIDLPFHHIWRCKYAGMNQAAFGYMQEKYKGKIKLHKFKTIEFNAVDCDWTSINKHTVFIHYKSKLRKTVLGEIKGRSEYKPVVDIWNKMYKEMLKDKS